MFKDKNNVVLAISAALIVLAAIIAIVSTVVEKNRIDDNSTKPEVISTTEQTKNNSNNGTTLPPQTTTPVVQDGNTPGKYTVATQNDPLGVRISPKADAERIYEFPKGSEIDVLCTYSEWAFVESDGVSGWVNLNYLQLKEKSETPKHSAGKYTISTQDDPLGIRVKPHGDAQRNGEVPKGQEVDVLTVCGDWGYVEYGEYSGWLSFQYLILA